MRRSGHATSISSPDDAPPGNERRRHAMECMRGARFWSRSSAYFRRKGMPRAAAACHRKALDRLALARHYDAAARLLGFSLPGG